MSFLPCFLKCFGKLEPDECNESGPPVRKSAIKETGAIAQRAHQLASDLLALAPTPCNWVQHIKWSLEFLLVNLEAEQCHLALFSGTAGMAFIMSADEAAGRTHNAATPPPATGNTSGWCPRQNTSTNTSPARPELQDSGQLYNSLQQGSRSVPVLLTCMGETKRIFPADSRPNPAAQATTPLTHGSPPATTITRPHDHDVTVAVHRGDLLALPCTIRGRLVGALLVGWARAPQPPSDGARTAAQAGPQASSTPGPVPAVGPGAFQQDSSRSGSGRRLSTGASNANRSVQGPGGTSEPGPGGATPPGRCLGGVAAPAAAPPACLVLGGDDVRAIETLAQLTLFGLFARAEGDEYLSRVSDTLVVMPLCITVQELMTWLLVAVRSLLYQRTALDLVPLLVAIHGSAQPATIFALRNPEDTLTTFSTATMLLLGTGPGESKASASGGNTTGSGGGRCYPHTAAGIVGAAVTTGAGDFKMGIGPPSRGFGAGALSSGALPVPFRGMTAAGCGGSGGGLASESHLKMVGYTSGAMSGSSQTQSSNLGPVRQRLAGLMVRATSLPVGGTLLAEAVIKRKAAQQYAEAAALPAASALSISAPTYSASRLNHSTSSQIQPISHTPRPPLTSAVAPPAHDAAVASATATTPATPAQATYRPAVPDPWVTTTHIIPDATTLLLDASSASADIQLCSRLAHLPRLGSLMLFVEPAPATHPTPPLLTLTPLRDVTTPYGGPEHPSSSIMSSLRHAEPYDVKGPGAVLVAGAGMGGCLPAPQLAMYVVSGQVLPGRLLQHVESELQPLLELVLRTCHRVLRARLAAEWDSLRATLIPMGTSPDGSAGSDANAAAAAAGAPAPASGVPMADAPPLLAGGGIACAPAASAAAAAAAAGGQQGLAETGSSAVRAAAASGAASVAAVNLVAPSHRSHRFAAAGRMPWQRLRRPTSSSTHALPRCGSSSDMPAALALPPGLQTIGSGGRRATNGAKLEPEAETGGAGAGSGGAARATLASLLRRSASSLGGAETGGWEVPQSLLNIESDLHLQELSHDVVPVPRLLRGNSQPIRNTQPSVVLEALTPPSPMELMISSLRYKLMQSSAAPSSSGAACEAAATAGGAPGSLAGGLHRSPSWGGSHTAESTTASAGRGPLPYQSWSLGPAAGAPAEGAQSGSGVTGGGGAGAAASPPQQQRGSLASDLQALQLYEVLGRGGQGVVLRGSWGGLETAVKCIKQREDGGWGGRGGGGGGGGGGTSRAVGPQAGAGAAGGSERPAGGAEQIQGRRRLLRGAVELAVASSLSHPNIVQVYAVFLDVAIVRVRGRSSLDPWGRSQGGDGGGNLASSSNASNASAAYLRVLPWNAPMLQESSKNVPLFSLLCLEYCDAGTLLTASRGGAFRLAPIATGAAAAGAPSGLSGGRRPTNVDRPPGALALVPLYTSLLEVALSLRHLHSRRLVHGDVKPANVLLKGSSRDPRGWTCKLSDFGCARLLTEEEAAAGGVRQPNPTGTPAYMAPEILITGGFQGFQTDVYAFGIMMWELISGSTPYARVDPPSLPGLVVKQGLRPSFPPLVPPEYCLLAIQCWSRAPNSRPTAALLVERLQSLLERARLESGASLMRPSHQTHDAHHSTREPQPAPQPRRQAAADNAAAACRPQAADPRPAPLRAPLRAPSAAFHVEQSRLTAPAGQLLDRLMGCAAQEPARDGGEQEEEQEPVREPGRKKETEQEQEPGHGERQQQQQQSPCGASSSPTGGLGPELTEGAEDTGAGASASAAAAVATAPGATAAANATTAMVLTTASAATAAATATASPAASSVPRLVPRQHLRSALMALQPGGPRGSVPPPPPLPAHPGLPGGVLDPSLLEMAGSTGVTADAVAVTNTKGLLG